MPPDLLKCGYRAAPAVCYHPGAMADPYAGGIDVVDAARPWPCCQDPSREEWRPVAGYEQSYAVSSYGRVVHTGPRARPGRFKATWIERRGYPNVHLSVDNIGKAFYLHKIVASTFFGPLPAGWSTNHKDGDKLHCCIANLEYLGPGLNQAHAAAMGLTRRGEQVSTARLTVEAVREIRRLRGQVPQKELARRFGVAHSLISRIQLGQAWRHTTGGLPADSGMNEAQWQAQVIQLARLYRWHVHHCRPAMRASGQWSTPIQGDPGFPDLVLAKAGRVIFAELKIDDPHSTLGPEQAAWRDVLTGDGVEWFCWRPRQLEQVKDILAPDRGRL